MTALQDEKWFLQVSGQIQGPFTQPHMEQTLQSLSSDQLSTALVWKRGFAEWVRVDKWQTTEISEPQPDHYDDLDISDIALPESSGTVRPGTEKIDLTQLDQNLFEKTFSGQIAENVFYRVQINFVDQPLMTKAELMTLIAKQQDVTQVSIQDPKSKDWKDVYAFPDIVERLGLSRRKQSRVPILAQFSGRSSKSQQASYRLITISQGGMGFTENFELQIGDEVDGHISSPHFFQAVHVKAEVIYAGHDGYIGLKFKDLTDEARSAIIEYIKKFGKDSAESPV